MKLSVLIPTYNHEKFIAKAIEGALAQETNFKFEILIGEDDSEDGTREICKYYAHQNPEKIRLFLNSRENVIYIDGKPTGRANLINLLKNASGKYIALCEGDDYWTDKQKLQIQYNFLEKNLDAAICFHNVQWLKDGILKNDPGLRPTDRNWFTIDDLFLYDNFIRTCSVFFRNGLFKKIPEWFYKVPYGDIALHMMNAKHGKIGLVDKTMAVYRVHRNGTYSGESPIKNITKSIHEFNIIAENLGLSDSESYKIGMVKFHYSLSNEATMAAKKIIRSISKKKKNNTNILVKHDTEIPTVSVIIPTFNRPNMLLKSIQSVLNQSFKNFEILVVNDAGTDVTSIIKNFRDERIKLKNHSRNIGLAASRNTGIKNAVGKYITYLDDDDIYYPNHLEILVNCLENTDYKVAYTDAYRVHYTNKNGIMVETHRDLPYSCDFDYERILIHNFVPVLCFMHLKSCLETTGVFDETLTSHEDWDLWIRMSRIYKFAHVRKVTAEYSWRTDGSTMTSGNRADMLLTMKAIYFKHSALVKEIPDITLLQRKNIKLLERQIIPKNKRIKFSIIIPVHNKIEYTRNCLDALFKNTPVDIIEVIVVDNNSTDGTIEYLSTITEKVKVIKNKENLGFAKASNQGAKKSLGEYLVFLNNDTEVQSEWLTTLHDVIEQDKSVAAVGSKMLFPNNKIQHAGVIIVDDQKLQDPLMAKHNYYKKNSNHPKANEISTYQALTAACLLVRRSAFETVEGFDEQYWNGYEDIDLCFKLQKRGWLLIYEPKSVVIHYESQSGPERFSRVQQNIERLHQKWLGKIIPDMIIKPNGEIIKTETGRIRPYQLEGSLNTKLDEKKLPNKKLISIIILAHNQIEYTKKCLESILKNTLEPFELIVVDNGSIDGTVEYLESEFLRKNDDVRIKIIKNSENKGFASGNNQGIATSSGDYILLLNNDVVVTPGWLERMISCCEKRPEIGIVGPRSNYVSGPQLLEPVDYNLDSLEGLNRFSKKVTTINAKKSTQLLRVVGFCMLIKRSVIDKIGGMDDRFGIGNFEDDDFSLRAALAGFESWMAEDCFVHHFGSRTFIGEKIDYRQSLQQNWKIFKEKWGLPDDLPYGSPYSISQMKVKEFNPHVHYIPLSINDENSINTFFDIRSSVEQEYSLVSSSINIKDIKTAIEEASTIC